jgi:hypothetical protein
MNSKWKVERKLKPTVSSIRPLTGKSKLQTKVKSCDKERRMINIHSVEKNDNTNDQINTSWKCKVKTW